jgi:hypothetical protein
MVGMDPPSRMNIGFTLAAPGATSGPFLVRKPRANGPRKQPPRCQRPPPSHKPHRRRLRSRSRTLVSLWLRQVQHLVHFSWGWWQSDQTWPGLATRREGGSIPTIRFLEKEFSAPAANLPCGQASDNAHLDTSNAIQSYFTKTERDTQDLSTKLANTYRKISRLLYMCIFSGAVTFLARSLHLCSRSSPN